MNIAFKLSRLAAYKITLILGAIGVMGLAGQPIEAQTDKAKPAAKFTDQQLEFFESKVRPLLVEKCFECHGPDATPIEGSLSLTSRKAIISGGDTGPAIVSGHPEKSLLIDAINYGEVYEMPPDTKMSDDEIAILTKWVKEGAAWPESSDVAVESKEEFDLAARKAKHWSWQPIRKPTLPNVQNTEWPQDPIDNFILSKVEEAGLKPAGSANRETLIRRAYFDIIGLPPSPEKIVAFLEDDAPNAFEKVIDELLASPQFGERWARHWMDLTRYAESGGHEFDYEIRHAFRYRDYLIRAFNEDVSYKQLVHEHIAGDLLPNPRRHPTDDFNESILGTGFWFLGEAKHSPVDSKEEEARTIDNQIDVMSKTFLGMTVACARCHDHKFDAISTEDYYALCGFLQSSRRQEAMLDPGRKIENNFTKAKQLVESGDKLAGKLVNQLKTADAPSVAKYLDASLEFLRADPDWNQQASVLIEGESLKQISVDGGETLPQTIKKRNKLAWRGNKQYWWKHGKTGDAWVLEFEAPNTNDQYEVAVVFTKAADYGAAKILINDAVAREKADFYDRELITEKLSFSDLKINSGKNQLKVILLDHHPDAAPSNMIGIDYLELTPINNRLPNESETIEAIAESNQLDSSLLKTFVAAVRDPATASPAHPLHLVYRASKDSQVIDSSFSNELKKSATANKTRHEKWLEESTLFEGFENGLPDDWFKTGFAFGDREQRASNELQFAATGQLLSASNWIHSGKYGANLYGVIRSPTFELKHSHLHSRCFGKNTTIRLIIDGYVMDEFNALLFKGCRHNIRESNHFNWETQSQDIKNHIGNLAHIEVIDHGDGFFALDEIRFSNGARPPTAASPLLNQLAADGFDSRESFAKSAANAMVANLSQETRPADVGLADWILQNDLMAVFSDSSSSKVSKQRSHTSWRSVAAVSNVEESDGESLLSELKSVRNRLSELNAKTPYPELAIAMTDGTGEEERVFIRGNHKTLGQVATRRFLSAISPRPLNPPSGSGRLQLAHKITAPNNPLTNRVAVNRIWHHLLGRGIVGSVDNFGVLGKTPTHPKLLDYLATEFAADGQSLKRMIKRIALTRTYQMDSSPTEEGSRIDPDNDLLHRARIRRLQGEAIRDSILKVSGSLDLKMFGPPVPIHLTSFMSGRGRPGKSGPLDGEGRRSIYISVRRNFLSPMMLAFDTPIPFNAIGARNQSNVPAQALILMNDPFVIEQAKRWAERLIQREQSEAQRIEAIYFTALGREPTPQELEKALEFLKQQAAEIGIIESDLQTNQETWQDFCHVVFNLKEFIYIQ